MKGNDASVEPEEIKQPSGVMRALSHTLNPSTPSVDEITGPLGENGAHDLLKRTPSNYLINQIYGLWVYLSLFLLTILLTRSTQVTEYTVYVDAAAAFNTIAYIVAFGMEDATTTFVPRLAAEHGQAAAASLVRRLLLIRLAILGLTLGILFFSLPALATFFALIPTSLTAGIAASLRDPNLQKHIAPVAFWVLANGVFSLLNSVYAALMRMKVVFIVGGLAQLLLLGLGFVFLHLGWGIESILWLQGGVTFVGALAFAAWLSPILFTRGATYKQPLGPVFRLGLAAWFTNLVSGALLKQISLLLLIAFATQVAQAYFNVSFQLTDGANLLLVSGFGGVGVAALAASFVGSNYGRLSRIWQTLIKIETLLSAPGLIFCLFNAQNIVVTLYGEKYAPAGQLFALFVALNLVVRVLGMTVHQSTLYVLGKSRWVVIAQWVGLVVVLGLGFLLVPRWGAAGALVADGVSRLITYLLMLLFLWKDLPEKYPLGYTLRIVLATAVGGLPGLIFHPTGKVMLLVFAVVFIMIAGLMLTVVRPLSKKDLDMIAEIRPGVARYLKWFTRRAPATD
ncbi:MAG TPA: polysaccharide biosynthesis C-terminal domain-containing protein [Ktedonobacteraceae bacterium]